MTIQTIKNVVWRGTCPGGFYHDNMGKKLPCPQKTIETVAKSNKAPIMFCPRCGSEITPKMEVSSTMGIFDIE